jgi:hypothetical protein
MSPALPITTIPSIFAVSVLIGKGIRKSEAVVQRKYMWLYHQYIQAIDVFKQLNEDDPYRIENEENRDLIIALPRFEKDAAVACKAVAKLIATEKRREE